MAPVDKTLRERVRIAADAVLARTPSVGPLELLMELRWLAPPHIDQWRKGNPVFANLESHFQSVPAKRAQVFEYFLEWARERGLTPVTASYALRSARENRPLQVTVSGNETEEAYFRTHFARPDLSPKRTEKLKEKLTKSPEIVVYMVVGEPRPCGECGAVIDTGDFSVVERSQPLCLQCADLDHLVFLPSGDATLTRRVKKLSPLSAVVVKFRRSRNRYERQGLLVTEDAIAQGEAQCEADAPERAARRTQAAALRQIEDQAFIVEMTKAILELFPRCPREIAQKIAAHAGTRGSGRVGRSAAGRALQSRALELAVIAHIRHQYTPYDELLMRGIDRLEARAMIQDDLRRQLDRWRA